MINKILNFKPIRNLDTFLLVNYPVVWRSRIHYILLFWLLPAGLLLTLTAALYPVSADHLPDETFFSNVVLVFYLASVLVWLLWGYSQHKLPLDVMKFSDYLITFALFWAGTFLLYLIGLAFVVVLSGKMYWKHLADNPDFKKEYAFFVKHKGFFTPPEGEADQGLLLADPGDLDGQRMKDLLRKYYFDSAYTVTPKVSVVRVLDTLSSLDQLVSWNDSFELTRLDKPLDTLTTYQLTLLPTREGTRKRYEQALGSLEAEYGLSWNPIMEKLMEDRTYARSNDSLQRVKTRLDSALAADRRILDSVFHPLPEHGYAYLLQRKSDYDKAIREIKANYSGLTLDVDCILTTFGLNLLEEEYTAHQRQLLDILVNNEAESERIHQEIEETEMRLERIIDEESGLLENEFLSQSVAQYQDQVEGLEARLNQIQNLQDPARLVSEFQNLNAGYERNKKEYIKTLSSVSPRTGLTNCNTAILEKKYQQVRNHYFDKFVSTQSGTESVPPYFEQYRESGQFSADLVAFYDHLAQEKQQKINSLKDSVSSLSDKSYSDLKSFLFWKFSVEEDFHPDLAFLNCRRYLDSLYFSKYQDLYLAEEESTRDALSRIFAINFSYLGTTLSAADGALPNNKIGKYFNNLAAIQQSFRQEMGFSSELEQGLNPEQSLYPHPVLTGSFQDARMRILRAGNFFRFRGERFQRFVVSEFMAMASMALISAIIFFLLCYRSFRYLFFMVLTIVGGSILLYIALLILSSNKWLTEGKYSEILGYLLFVVPILGLFGLGLWLCLKKKVKNVWGTRLVTGFLIVFSYFFAAYMLYMSLTRNEGAGASGQGILEHEILSFSLFFGVALLVVYVSLKALNRQETLPLAY